MVDLHRQLPGLDSTPECDLGWFATNPKRQVIA
jgi:hypothetical protein